MWRNWFIPVDFLAMRVPSNTFCTAYECKVLWYITMEGNVRWYITMEGNVRWYITFEGNVRWYITMEGNVWCDISLGKVYTYYKVLPIKPHKCVYFDPVSKCTYLRHRLHICSTLVLTLYSMIQELWSCCFSLLADISFRVSYHIFIHIPRGCCTDNGAILCQLKQSWRIWVNRLPIMNKTQQTAFRVHISWVVVQWMFPPPWYIPWYCYMTWCWWPTPLGHVHLTTQAGTDCSLDILRSFFSSVPTIHIFMRCFYKYQVWPRFCIVVYNVIYWLIKR